MDLDRIIKESIDKVLLEGILSSFTWQDVGFIEGDIEPDNCERIIVTVKGQEIPVEVINLKAQQTRIGKIQLHIFIDKKFQKQGVATKIYTAFIHEFGGIYSGFGRIMNKPAIFSIYKKLKNEPDITVRFVRGSDGKPFGIEAFLKQKEQP